MKKLKYLINILLSIVICLISVVTILLLYLKFSLFNSANLITYFETNKFYDDKYEYITQQIDDLMFNSGVGSKFTESIMPSKELIKICIDNSVKNILVQPFEENTMLKSYNLDISEKFAEEAVRQGLTEDNDISEITYIYCDDIMSIIDETAKISGESTLKAYTSRVISLIDNYWIYLLISLVLISVYFFFINNRKSPIWIAVPYLSSFLIFLVSYIIFRSSDIASFSEPFQKSLIMLADNAFRMCVFTAFILLAISMFVLFLSILINKIRGNKSDKE